MACYRVAAWEKARKLKHVNRAVNREGIASFLGTSAYCGELPLPAKDFWTFQQLPDVGLRREENGNTLIGADWRRSACHRLRPGPGTLKLNPQSGDVEF